MKTESLAAFGATVLILCLTIVAMSMGFTDEQEDQKYYCEMVESGAWGDYNNWFKEGLCDDK